MADALDGAGAREQRESARLADVARQAAGGCLSASLVAAAGAVLAIVAGKGGDPARALRQLRTDPALAGALASDISRARDQVAGLLSDALWRGFQTGADTRGACLPLRIDLDDSDRRDLGDYPILGHTADEIAGDLAARLRWDLDVALAQPLTTSADPQAIPTALGAVAQQHAQRVAGAVDEAYHAGVQAAVRAIGAALTGMAI